MAADALDSRWKALKKLGWLDVLDRDLFPVQGEYLWRHCLPFHGLQLHKNYQAVLSTLQGPSLSAEELAVRGRVRRILNDGAGALGDFALARAADRDCAWTPAFEGESKCAGEPARALLDLDAAMARLPASAPVRVWRGCALLRLGRLEEALAEADRAVSWAPGLRAARLLKAEARRRMGDPEGAADDFSALIRKDPLCSGLYALRSAARAERGDRAGAIDDAHQAVERHPDNVRPFAALAGITEIPSEDMFGGVLLEAMRRLERDPGLTWTMIAGKYPRRAWPLAYAGRESAGLKEIAAAQRLSPWAGWIRAWRGRCLAVSGRPRESLRAYAEAIRLDRHYRIAYAWRAEVWENMGEDARALKDLDAALDGGGRASHHLRRARIRLRTNAAPEALEDILRCMLADSRIALIYSGIAESAAGKPPPPAATPEQLKSPDFGAKPALRALWLGRLRLDAGDPDAACALLSEAAQDALALNLARAWRAEALCRLGSFARALAEADAALRVNKDFLPAKACRAAALRGLGDEAAADEEIEAACAGSPHAPGVAAWALRAGKAPAASARSGSGGGWEVVVDERVELFSAALALSRGPCCPATESGWLKRAREQMPARHPAYRLAAKFWAAGGSSPRFARAAGERPLICAGGRPRAPEELTEALRDLAAKGFSEFFAAERPSFDSMLAAARARARRLDHRRALELYLGPDAPPPHRFRIVASPLLHGADGVSAGCAENAEGGLEIFVAWGHEVPWRSRPDVAMDAAKTMRSAWRAVVEAMLIRDGARLPWTETDRSAVAEAVLLRLEAVECGEECSRRLSREAETSGFWRAGALSRLLLKYEQDRARFRTLRDFYPWLTRGLQSLEARKPGPSD